MARTNQNKMLLPDDDDQEPIEIDQAAKKRWITGGDKPAAKTAEPLPELEPKITVKKVLLSVDSDLLELYDKAAKKRRMTRTAWINQSCLAQLERDNIQ
jgi:hypothetical protein